MKIQLKKMLTDIPLHCIASFVIGAYTILLIEYFWFNKDITPPGVSAFIAAMALLFTIYAAFKVKEWSEQKMNDKAFKVAEEIISKINESYVEFMFASTNLLLLTGRTDNAKIFREEPTFKTYVQHFQKSTDAHLQSVNLLDTLPIWKYNTPYRNIFFRFRTKTKEFNELFFEAFNIACTTGKDRTDEFRAFDSRLKSKKEEVKNVYEELTALTFDKIFIPASKMS